jgi:hypothetical protein
MNTKGIQYSSTTRLRDYIKYVFNLGTIEDREALLKKLNEAIGGA